MRSVLNSLPLTRMKIGVARWLYRLVKLCHQRDDQVITRGGVRYRVDLSEGIDLSLYLFGHFQSHVARNRHVRIPPDGVVLDVGANVGVMTLRFADAVPDGKVYAFEPTHRAFARLAENLSLNPGLAGRVKAVQTFVSGPDRQADRPVAYASWKVGGGRRDGNVHPIHLGTQLATDGVGALALDEFVRSEGLTRVDFLKIDTDGHEPDVLRGASATIDRFRPPVIFEVGQYVLREKGLGSDFYLDYFGSRGYALSDSATGRPITAENWDRVVPKWASIDVLALPLAAAAADRRAA